MLVRAPLRISFFGGGSDLPEFFHDEPGAVLSATIDRYAWVRLSNSIGATFSANQSDQPVLPGHYLSFAHRELFSHRSPGYTKQVFVSVDAPVNSGLGASSALVVALTAASGYADLQDSNKYWRGGSTWPSRIADVAYTVERHHCGAQIGMQDHFAAAYGGIRKYFFDHINGRETVVSSANQLVNSPDARAKFASHLLLVRVGKRAPASGVLSAMLDLRKGDMKEAVRFGVQAVNSAATMLSNDMYEAFGRLLHEAWLRKRSVTPISEAVDAVYRAARAEGAWGGKVCGAGGTGYMVIMSPPDRRAAIMRLLQGAYSLNVETVVLTTKGCTILNHLDSD